MSALGCSILDQMNYDIGPIQFNLYIGMLSNKINFKFTQTIDNSINNGLKSFKIRVTPYCQTHKTFYIL